MPLLPERVFGLLRYLMVLCVFVGWFWLVLLAAQEHLTWLGVALIAVPILFFYLSVKIDRYVGGVDRRISDLERKVSSIEKSKPMTDEELQRLMVECEEIEHREAERST